jgi:hypothetical protein
VRATSNLTAETAQSYPGLTGETQSTLPSRRELRESQVETGTPARQSFLEQNGYPSVPSPAVQPERALQPEQAVQLEQTLQPESLFPGGTVGGSAPTPAATRETVWDVAGESAKPSVPEWQTTGNQPVQSAWPVQEAWNIQDSRPVAEVQPAEPEAPANVWPTKDAWPVQDSWPLQTAEQPAAPAAAQQNQWNLPLEPTAGSTPATVSAPSPKNAWDQPVIEPLLIDPQSATPATDGIATLFGSVDSAPITAAPTDPAPITAVPITPIPIAGSVPTSAMPTTPSEAPVNPQSWGLTQAPRQETSQLNFSSPSSPASPSQSSFPSAGGSLGQWGLTPRSGDYSSSSRSAQTGSRSRRSIVESSSTFWVWVIAISPILAAGGIGYVLKTSGLSFSTWMLPVAIVAPYVVILLLAIADRSSLEQLGHEEPASWGWAALTAPVYLLVRASATRRETGTGSGPAVTWFVSVVVAVIGFVGYGLLTGEPLVTGLPS